MVEVAAVKTVKTVPSDTDVADIVSIYRRDGCVVISDLAPGSTMDRITEELEPWLAAARPGGSDFVGHETRRTGAVIARSPTARHLITHPLLLDVLDAVLADHATTYQIDLTQMIDIGPGQSTQPVHRDQWTFDNHPFPPGFEAEVNTMWAVSDFTEANGATRVVIGSHLWEDNPPEVDPAVTSPAEMARGSLLIYSGLLYHGGGPNTTDTHRIGMNIGYTLGWLRQEENQYIVCPPETLRQLPEGLLRLMGYQRGAFNLGYVDDMGDPLDWLDGRPTDYVEPFAFRRDVRRGIRRTEPPTWTT